MAMWTNACTYIAEQHHTPCTLTTPAEATHMAARISIHVHTYPYIPIHISAKMSMAYVSLHYFVNMYLHLCLPPCLVPLSTHMSTHLPTHMSVHTTDSARRLPLLRSDRLQLWSGFAIGCMQRPCAQTMRIGHVIGHAHRPCGRAMWIGNVHRSRVGHACRPCG